MFDEVCFLGHVFFFCAAVDGCLGATNAVIIISARALVSLRGIFRF
jgi:hypothetical protein